jgi:hypothetical protein
MKTIHTPSSRFKSILQNMEVAGRTGWRLAKAGSRTLARMPWPVLLLVAIFLAALLTIVPLVLGLFIALLVLKFVVSAVFGPGPRDITVYKPQATHPQPPAQE